MLPCTHHRTLVYRSSDKTHSIYKSLITRNTTMKELNKFQRIRKAIFTKSYVGYSHPKDIVEWIENTRGNIQEFFRLINIRWQNATNREYQDCPYRLADPMGDRWVGAGKRDCWFRTGKDRTCSYCGSWHPDEFLAFLDEVVRTKAEKCSIDVADNHNKVYVNRPNVKNAHEGAIKFKINHLSKKQYEDNYLKLVEASHLSSEMHNRKYKTV